MNHKRTVLLALAGVLLGGLVAWQVRPRLLPPPPTPPQAPVPPEQTSTPAQRQSRDRYTDETFAFTLAAAPGWYNETGSNLRKQFTSARGVIVKANSRNTVFMQIDALAVVGRRPPLAEFGASVQGALVEAGKVLEAGPTEIAGLPAYSILTESSSRFGQGHVRHVFIYAPKGNIHLSCTDMAGTYPKNATAFEQMLKSFQTTGQ